MARKTKTHAKLKKELDKVFSQYIRWAYANDSGMVECYTCGVIKHVKEMHNGHFQSRKHTSTRWHENNCRPQCPKCNLYSEGEKWIYGNKLVAELGRDTVDEIVALSHKSVKYSKTDLQYLIETYKKKLKELCE
jgi:hypothetical protein|tara:strand:+ start:433 stop:834 length:402 start_codon:yes stop_codon:yes gene_type:complete